MLPSSSLDTARFLGNNSLEFLHTIFDPAGRTPTLKNFKNIKMTYSKAPDSN